MPVERYWILLAKQLCAQATGAELDELAGYTTLPAEWRLLTHMFNNVTQALLIPKDTTNLLRRIKLTDYYINTILPNETATI